jgi:hypothetical protein
VRAALRWAPGSRVYRSDQEGFEAGPEEATWFHGDLSQRDPLGESGVGLGGLAWLGDRWGAELDLRWTRARVLPDFTFPSHEEAVDDAGEPLDLPDPDTAWDYTEWSHTSITFRLMGRYRQDLPGPLYAFGGAGLGRAETVLFTWSDRAPQLVDTPMFGGRVAAGAGLDLGRVWAEVAVGELLTPWPVSTELDADLDIGILPELALRLGADLGWRRATFEVDGSEIEVVDAVHSLNIGIVGTLR